MNIDMNIVFIVFKCLLKTWIIRWNQVHYLLWTHPFILNMLIFLYSVK